MADVTAKVIHQTKQRAGRISVPMANGVTLYEGMLVGEEGGYANHWRDNAADHFLGICLGGDDRANDGVLTGNTSDTPVPEAHIDSSGVELCHLAAIAGPTLTQANLYDYVYCATSNVADIDLQSSGNTSPIGYISRFVSATDFNVTLVTPAEFKAQATA